ncbi:hypothetical protein ACJ41O_007489 [Fusarium nematophilum]
MAPTHEQQDPMAASQTEDISDNSQDERKAPQTLKASAPSWFWRVGVPATLITIPLAYISLIIMVVYLRNKTQSPFGDNVMEVLQVASTLWLISFAAVMGPFLKTLALHCARKGLPWAFKNLVTIRHMQVWTLGVALLWCPSHLGGQAAVRSLSLQPSSIRLETPALYYHGGNVSDLNMFYSSSIDTDTGTFAGASGANTLISDMRSSIVSLFFTPGVLASHSNGSSDKFEAVIETLGGRQQAVQVGQRDLWRNVRIPFMELLPDYDPEDPMSWLSVPSDMVVPYASLIGIPIRGGSFNRTGNSTLVIQSHYQTLSCGAEFNGSSWVQTGSTKLKYNTPNSSGGLNDQYIGVAPNGAEPNIFLAVVNNMTTLKEHLGLMEYPLVEPSSKLELLVGGNCSNVTSPSTTMFRQCKVSTSYIDIEVACTRLDSLDKLQCKAERVRHTPGFPIAGNLTALSNGRMMEGIIWEMPFTTASYSYMSSSNLEMYGLI